MIDRTGFLRAACSAVVLAVVALLVVGPPASAASSVQIDARALVGGRYEVSGWAAISVSLGNEGEPTAGFLVAETRSGVVRHHVELPAGARKTVTLYLQPEAFQRRITVRYEEPNGSVEAVVEVRVLEQSRSQSVIVGDPDGVLRSQIAGAMPHAPEPLVLAVSDLPERPEPLSGLSAMVWAADAGRLDEDQRRSLERWVTDGGRLVVVGGADWQARAAAFAELLPLDSLVATDGVPQAALAAWAGVARPALDVATVSAGSLREGSRSIVRDADDTILVSMRTHGSGMVVLLGTDLGTDAHRGWDGAGRLWDRLLPAGLGLDGMGGEFPVRAEAESMMSQALSNLPTLDVPPAELLLAVIIGYILLIGPVSYVVLRRLDRRELAWITAPLLVVLFTACSFGIGTAMRGSDVIINQVTLIRTSGTDGTALAQAYAGIFSPERATYRLRADADALMGRLPMLYAPEPTGPSIVIEQGVPAGIEGLEVGLLFDAVRADAFVEHRGSLSIEWRRNGDETIGTVTNVSDAPISDIAYISTWGGRMIGDLEAGASADFRVSDRNINATSASDQVYGFGGFGAADEEQRLIGARRQVIDALVGYGSGLRVSTLHVGRGPYVIGWRAGDGPLPVQIEDHESKRFGQVVEVTSVPRALITGEMRLGPADMGSRVVATDGQAETLGQGQVNLVDGSATWEITLPLEASALVASELEVIVGPDPYSVLVDEGGGFWQPGLTVELRDPRSGGWRSLGDPAERSRFNVADPGTILGASGRIEVRVSGTAEFGSPVFVSVSVTGVVSE
jgi:hypothetical protein